MQKLPRAIISILLPLLPGAIILLPASLFVYHEGNCFLRAPAVRPEAPPWWVNQYLSLFASPLGAMAMIIAALASLLCFIIGAFLSRRRSFKFALALFLVSLTIFFVRSQVETCFVYYEVLNEK